jgi:hypothetical protein
MSRSGRVFGMWGGRGKREERKEKDREVGEE